jgi:hypothetical protein
MDNPETPVTLDTRRITNTNKKEAQHIYDLEKRLATQRK